MRWALIAVAAYASLSALASPVEDQSPLHALPASEQEAMTWIAANTPAEAAFVVMSGTVQPVWRDPRSEWFPALSGRVNEATVQGREWRHDGNLFALADRYDDLQACTDLPAACIDDWSRAYGVSFTHVYVPLPEVEVSKAGLTRTAMGVERDCCAALRASLAASGQYRLIYDGSGAQIFERLTVANASP
jgi:hypothetical protein